MKIVAWIFLIGGAAWLIFSFARRNEIASNVDPNGHIGGGLVRVPGSVYQPNLSGPNQATLDWARPQGIQETQSHWYTPVLTINL